jgi:ABC-type transporter Mla subunit MlaD
MSEPTRYWKLGLFLVLGTLVGLSAIVFVGTRTFGEETVTFRTYFDESVSGLDVGATVSFRGVRVGNVSAIGLAPDGRHVEVLFEIKDSVLDTLGLSAARKKGRPLRVPPRLRVQVSNTSITGNKFLKLDLFGPPLQPPPTLPFEPGQNYIPAYPSTLKNLEDALVRAVDQLPELVHAAQQVLGQTQSILSDFEHRDLPHHAEQVLVRAEHVMASVERTLRELKAGELSAQARMTLQNLDLTLTSMREILERAARPDGLLDDVERAAAGIGDLTRQVAPAGHDIEETLRSLRSMADSVRRLTEALEIDPDMLLKGRAREERP